MKLKPGIYSSSRKLNLWYTPHRFSNHRFLALAPRDQDKIKSEKVDINGRKFIIVGAYRDKDAKSGRYFLNPRFNDPVDVAAFRRIAGESTDGLPGEAIKIKGGDSKIKSILSKYKKIMDGKRRYPSMIENIIGSANSNSYIRELSESAGIEFPAMSRMTKGDNFHTSSLQKIANAINPIEKKKATHHKQVLSKCDKDINMRKKKKSTNIGDIATSSILGGIVASSGVKAHKLLSKPLVGYVMKGSSPVEDAVSERLIRGAKFRGVSNLNTYSMPPFAAGPMVSNVIRKHGRIGNNVIRKNVMSGLLPKGNIINVKKSLHPSGVAHELGHATRMGKINEVIQGISRSASRGLPVITPLIGALGSDYDSEGKKKSFLRRHGVPIAVGALSAPMLIEETAASLKGLRDVKRTMRGMNIPAGEAAKIIGNSRKRLGAAFATYAGVPLAAIGGYYAARKISDAIRRRKSKNSPDA